MESQFLLNLNLALHLVGLSVSIGVSLTKYISLTKIHTDRSIDCRKWISALKASRGLNSYLGTGIGVAILSGVLMMHLAYSAFMYQLWFQLKMVALLMIIATGIISIWAESKLRELLMREEARYYYLPEGKLTINGKVDLIKTATGFQLMLFLVIIILASFRFL